MDRQLSPEQKLISTKIKATVIAAAGGLTLSACGGNVMADRDAVQPATTCSAEISGNAARVKLSLEDLPANNQNQYVLAVAHVEGEAPQTAKLEGTRALFDDLTSGGKITGLDVKNLGPDDSLTLDENGVVVCNLKNAPGIQATSPEQPTKNSLPAAGY